jgi:hypothetical protein
MDSRVFSQLISSFINLDKNENSFPFSLNILEEDSTIEETLDVCEDTMDFMYDLEKDFLYSDKNNNQYVIGFHSIEDKFSVACEGKIQIFDSGFSAKTFFKFSYNEVFLYLFYNSLKYCPNYKIDIIKIYINEDGVHVAITKTFWLRLIQRKWKKIMKLRENLRLQRGKLSSQIYFQTYGKYPDSFSKQRAENLREPR